MPAAAKSAYRGRFAPSPTGPLHLGSLIAALASYLDAKANHGLWLLRMEDLDPPREVAGAAQAILDSLQHHGLHWDEDILWQSLRTTAYQDALQQLLEGGHAYYCRCSRRQLQAYGGIYPGLCRGCRQPPKQPHAIRLQLTDHPLGFQDSIQGPFQQQLQRQVGDIILLRKDGLFAYQLAVVIDDHEQNISHVLRGSDLLDSTPRQIFLQQRLALPTPNYAHIPVITHASGQKLSKQNYAPALDKLRAQHNLLQALVFLRQPLPPQQHRATVIDILRWAIDHWALQTIPATMGMTTDIVQQP